MNPLSLEQLSFLDIGPVELIAIAGALRIPLVGLWVEAPLPGPLPLVTDADVKPVRRALAAHDVAVHNLECFNLAPDMDLEAMKPALARGAELGAKSIVAINYTDPDLVRMADHFAALCASARDFGLLVNLEFFPSSFVRSLDQALRIVRASGADNACVTVDCLHVMRSGSSPDAVRGAPPDLIGYAQICDGPAEAPQDLSAEAFEERGLPGAGVFPLQAFAAALPPGVPLGIEIPSKTLRLSGLSPRERATRIVTDLRRIIGA